MVGITFRPGEEFGLLGIGAVAEHGEVDADAAAGVPVLHLCVQAADFLLLGLVLLLDDAALLGNRFQFLQGFIEDDLRAAGFGQWRKHRFFDALAVGVFRPVATRRGGDGHFTAYLRQTDIGNVVALRQLAHGRFPNFLIERIAVQSDGIGFADRFHVDHASMNTGRHQVNLR